MSTSLTLAYSTPRPSRLALAAVLANCLCLTGCNIAAWVGQAFRADEAPVAVKANYRGLENKRVAVLVSADEYTLFRFPRSPAALGTAMSNRIQSNVAGVSVALPGEVEAFRRQNPYWVSSRPSRLLDQLGVDRLVVVELNDYRTNEQGNANVWRGVIDAVVGVYEADAEVPDDRTFEQQVRAEFPENSRFGVLSHHAERHEIETAVLERFTLYAAGQFFDHERPPSR